LIKRIFILFIFTFFIFSCRTNTELVPQNFASLYSYSVSQINADIKVFNTGTDSSKIYIGIKKNKLMADRNGDIKLLFEISSFKNFTQWQKKDTLKYYLHKKYADINDYFITEFSLPSKSKKKLYVQLYITDLVKNIRSNYYLSMQNNNNFIFDNFLVRDKKTNKVLLTNYLTNHITIKINTSNINSNKCEIRYFNQKIPLALPAFYTKPARDILIKPDSIWEFNFSNLFRANKKGIYQFYKKDEKRGFVLYRYGDYFPKVRQIKQLLESFRYLMSKEEYAQIKNSKNLKQSVDSFWLDHTDNPQMAANLIKEYYSRVQAANRNFTSITEGWRSDRGMIFIVFGRPTNVYRYKDREVWRYGGRISFKALDFTFWKIDNMLSDNYYVLERKLSYKPLWYKAVEEWRSGSIYKWK